MSLISKLELIRMYADGLWPLFRDALTRLAPPAWVFLIPLMWLVAFVFKLGTRAALRNPWRRASPRTEAAEPGGRAVTIVLAGLLILGVMVMYARTPGQPQIPEESQAIACEAVPSAPDSGG